LRGFESGVHWSCGKQTFSASGFGVVGVAPSLSPVRSCTRSLR
jgi:hypothetical protein